MYDKEQDYFLNAVALLETDEEPETLLAILQEIERMLERNLTHKFGPRTIDLDVLLYGDITISVRARHHSTRPAAQVGTWQVAVPLQVPHPRMHERRFVLDPLCELINPTAIHPVLKKPWNELQKSVWNQECHKTDLIL